MLRLRSRHKHVLFFLSSIQLKSRLKKKKHRSHEFLIKFKRIQNWIAVTFNLAEVNFTFALITVDPRCSPGLHVSSYTRGKTVACRQVNVYQVVS